MKKLFTIIAALLVSYTSQAQAIRYHDVDPDTTIGYWEAFSALGADIWWHPSPEVVVKTWGSTEVLCDADTLPHALESGDDISPSASGTWSTLSYKCLNCGGVAGNWLGATDKYLAVRDKDGSGNWTYGWIRLDIPAGGTSFTIKEYAMHNTAGTAIKAGQAFGTGIGGQPSATETIQPLVQGRNVSFTGLAGNTTVAVTDMSGRTLIGQSIVNNEVINLSAYPAGIYLFHLRTAAGSHSFKVVAE